MASDLDTMRSNDPSVIASESTPNRVAGQERLASVVKQGLFWLTQSDSNFGCDCNGPTG